MKIEKRKRIIPVGWKEITIGEEFETISGGTPLTSNRSFYDGGTIPWINSGDLDKDYIDEASSFITKKGLENSNAKMVPANSVLVAMYGATAGKSSMLILTLVQIRRYALFVQMINIINIL